QFFLIETVLNNRLFLTPDHFIGVYGYDGKFIPARLIKSHDLVYVRNTTTNTIELVGIKNISIETKQGIYSPTLSGTIIVNNLVASCYGAPPGNSHEERHQVYASLRWLYRFKKDFLLLNEPFQSQTTGTPFIVTLTRNYHHMIKRVTDLTLALKTFILIEIITNISDYFQIIAGKKRDLRHNPCVVYLLSSSIADILELYSGLLIRCLNGFGADPTRHSERVCSEVLPSLLRVLTVTICILPISLSKLYQTLTMSMTTKSPLRLAIEGFTFQSAAIVSYINNSVIFFIYTLSGKIFRQELLRILRRQSSLKSSMQQTTRTIMRIQDIQ
ncbi:unnamed protein product, partial [Didymodactylos carnosus]